MTFLDQWQTQVNSSLSACAKLVPPASTVDLKYPLMVVGVLWPVRRPVQDFDLEAMQAVHTLLGDKGKLVLQMIQTWGDDPLAVARSLDANALQSGELGAACNHLIAHFNAPAVFDRAVTGQPKTGRPAAATDTTPTEPSLKRPRILVSYIRSDGEDLAIEVRQTIESEGLSVWADLGQFEGTRDWWQQITVALNQVSFLVLVMTPAAVKSGMVRKQWRYARQQGVCIFPVVKELIDFEQLPHWIRQVHFYNLNLEWPKLIKSLQGKCETPRIPFMAEDLPDDFVNRPAEIEQLLTHFFDSARQEPLYSTVALHGAGGYGKTLLARALSHNDDIRQVFDNGILWVTLGENPGDLSRYVIDLIEVLSGERPGFAGVDAAVVRLGELLADRDIFMVIDDVWNAAHLKPFLQGGPRCARLITTRDQSVLPLGTKTVAVGPMQQDEAVALLGSDLPYGYSNRLRQMAHHLGLWPLLLKLANGTMRERIYKNRERLSEALNYVDEALQKYGITAFDMNNLAARDQAVTQTIEISLGLLDDTERQRFRELAIFPEDVDIPLSTLEKLWGATAGLDDFDTEELCDHLYELSLLAHLDLTSRYIRLHKVMSGYLLHQQAETHQDDLVALHNTFLNTYAATIDQWAKMLPNERYMWDHLAFHLIRANRPAELVNLAKNLPYLAAKICIRGADRLEMDLLAAQTVAPADSELTLLRRMVSQSNHLLARCRTTNEAANTLHSRLAHIPPLASITVAAEAVLPRPWLTARHTLPDLPDPALIRTLYGHTTGVMDCAINTGGSVAVSIDKDNRLIVWNVSTGEAHQTVDNHPATLWGCDINGEGDVVAAAYHDGRVSVWDAHTGARLSLWSAHKTGIISCALNADASLLVTASKDKTLHVWEAQDQTKSFTKRFTLTGHHRSVIDCGIDARGTVIVSASNDGTLKVWDADTGKLRHTFTIRLVQPGVDRLTFLSQRDVNFNCAVSADGALVTATSSMGTITVWDIETGAERISFTGDKRGVHGCAFSADGSILVAAMNNGDLKAWDTAAGAERLTMAHHSRVVNSCSISADGAIIMSASDDKTLNVWDGRRTGGSAAAISYKAAARSCAISADGSIAASAMANKTVIIWDTATAAERLTLKGHTRKVNDVAISANGKTVVSVSQDQAVMVWDTQTGRQKLKLTGHAWDIHGCAISRDGSLIISASDDKSLKIWDANSGTEQFTLLEHTRNVNGCAIDAKGQLAVSASGDGTVKVWNAQNGEKLATLQGHLAWVENCAINEDGSVILSASYDKTLKVWDAASFTERCTLQGHTSSVTGCALTADGSLAVSVSRDATVRVWNTHTGECLTTLFVNDSLTDCACSADAGSIVAVGNSGVYFLRLQL